MSLRLHAGTHAHKSASTPRTLAARLALAWGLVLAVAATASAFGALAGH